VAMALYSAVRGLPREVSSVLFISSIGSIISIGSITLVHRLYLNTPLELASQPALRDMARIDKRAPAVIALATICWSLTTLAGLTPLEGKPWESIIRIR